MAEKIKPLSRRDDLVIQELNGEVLIYDLRSNKAFCLNETSARVWQACDGNNTVSDISRAIGSDDLVWLALNDLKKEKLVEHDLPTPSKFEGMTRRQVVKNIGLSSLLALPIIAGMTAPAAAQTGTCMQDFPGCTPNGMTCASDSSCCSCNCNASMQCTT